MDAKHNPYAPGAGTPPPILAGRDDLAAKADLVRGAGAGQRVSWMGLFRREARLIS